MNLANVTPSGKDNAYASLDNDLATCGVSNIDKL
jgi:hypothetical protein